MRIVFTQGSESSFLISVVTNQVWLTPHPHSHKNTQDIDLRGVPLLIRTQERIQWHLDQTIGKESSAMRISKLTGAVLEWQRRPLEEVKPSSTWTRYA